MLTIIACNKIGEQNQNIAKRNTDSEMFDDFETGKDLSLLNKTRVIDTLEIMVVQCANGYEYAQQGYDFNSIIEKELNHFENINIKPFPLKTLMGVSYQGVFDKKYCQPIIEKVNVDYLILTRFDNGVGIFDRSEQKWGYQLRVVNTKTLKQIKSIEAHNLNDYAEIKKHISDNIEKLKVDIETLK